MDMTSLELQKAAIQQSLDLVKQREEEERLRLFALGGEIGIAKRSGALEEDLLACDCRNRRNILQESQIPPLSDVPTLQSSSLNQLLNDDNNNDETETSPNAVLELVVQLQLYWNKYDPSFVYHGLDLLLQHLEQQQDTPACRANLVKAGILHLLAFCLQHHCYSTCVAKKACILLMKFPLDETLPLVHERQDVNPVVMQLMTEANVWDVLGQSVTVDNDNDHTPIASGSFQVEMQAQARVLARQQIPAVCQRIVQLQTVEQDPALLVKKVHFLRMSLASYWGDSTISSTNLCSYLRLNV